MSVHDQLLAVHFNFDSTTSGSTFSNTAAGISDGTYRRVCLSWNSLGGVVDLYYEDSKCHLIFTFELFNFTFKLFNLTFINKL